MLRARQKSTKMSHRHLIKKTDNTRQKTFFYLLDISVFQEYSRHNVLIYGQFVFPSCDGAQYGFLIRLKLQYFFCLHFKTLSVLLAAPVKSETDRVLQDQ